MNISEIMYSGTDYKYNLLGRLKADCRYYLGHGYRDASKLWAKNTRLQIEIMDILCRCLEYPCISPRGISELALSMGVNIFTKSEFIGRWENRGITFEIYRKWGDIKGDRLECYTYTIGYPSESRRFATSDRYMDVMDFLLSCQYSYGY